MTKNHWHSTIHISMIFHLWSPIFGVQHRLLYHLRWCWDHLSSGYPKATSQPGNTTDNTLLENTKHGTLMYSVLICLTYVWHVFNNFNICLTHVCFAFNTSVKIKYAHYTNCFTRMCVCVCVYVSVYHMRILRPSWVQWSCILDTLDTGEKNRGCTYIMQIIIILLQCYMSVM